MVNLRGSIGPNGYNPPDNVTVTWRRPGAPDISHPLNRSIQWTNDQTFRLRYGGGDSDTIGRQITAIGSEQLGGRAYLILKEIYSQSGLNRTPKEIGQEVWDFAISEGSGRPMDWCDYKRFTGKPDPICGENCPPCNGRDRVDTGNTTQEKVDSPTNLRLEGRLLYFDWTSEGVATFTAYRKMPSGSLFVLGTSRKSPILLQSKPIEGDSVILYATQRKKIAAEVIFRVGDRVVEPPEPEKPVNPPIDPSIPVILIEGEIRVSIDGKVRIYKLTEA